MTAKVKETTIMAVFHKKPFGQKYCADNSNLRNEETEINTEIKVHRNPVLFVHKFLVLLVMVSYSYFFLEVIAVTAKAIIHCFETISCTVVNEQYEAERSCLFSRHLSKRFQKSIK